MAEHLMMQSNFLRTGQCDCQANWDPLSIWKIFSHAFNLLCSTKIQELFRCQKKSCSMSQGERKIKTSQRQGGK